MLYTEDIFGDANPVASVAINEFNRRVRNECHHKDSLSVVTSWAINELQQYYERYDLAVVWEGYCSAYQVVKLSPTS